MWKCGQRKETVRLQYWFSHAERQSFNSVIQGSVSDIIKTGMLLINEYIKSKSKLNIR